MRQSFLDRTIAYLHQAKGTWPQIAEESGVPLRTLEKIARGETKNPGVAHIEKLLLYFNARADREALHQNSRDTT